MDRLQNALHSTATFWRSQAEKAEAVVRANSAEDHSALGPDESREARAAKNAAGRRVARKYAALAALHRQKESDCIHVGGGANAASGV